MNKKMIVATISLTLVFVFVFAACNGNVFKEPVTTTENTVYIDATGYAYVTDKSGNRVYDKEGAAVVYVTDKNGNKVTDSSGNLETAVRPFVPISEDGKVEYLGYKLVLPEGWEIIPEPNRYVNAEAKHKAAVSVIDDTYEEYYKSQRDTYDVLKAEAPEAVSWTEDVAIGSGCIKVVRFTLRKDNAMNVMYFFENNGNLYKIFFETENADTLIEDSLAFCKAITYKPYIYYIPEETTTAVATTK